MFEKSIRKVILNQVNNSPRIKYRPATADFFSKSGGQFQFSVGGPNWREPEVHGADQTSWVEKSGAVFVEAASPDPDNPGRLNWKNGKIVLALSDKDIGQILYGIRANQSKDELVKILHTNADKSVIKTFLVKKGQPGTYLLSLSQNKTHNSSGVDLANRINVSVYISAPDLLRLTSLLEAALPTVLGWDKV